MQEEEKSSGVFVAGFLLAALGLVVAPLALIGIISAVRDKGDGGGGTASAVTTANISLKEFSITGDLSVPAGDVTLNVKNDGSQVHNLYLKGGKGTKDIQPTQSDTLALGKLEPGTYTVSCLIPGHEAAGMKADLTVTAGGSVAATGSTGGHDGTIDYVALDKAMTDSILKFPATTKGQGNQQLAPKILADGTKQFEITTEIIDWEVSPGKVVKAWAYNGQVPGPAIRTEPGDKVKIVVTNKLPMGTDVHVHGVEMPFEMDGVSPITQKLIQPGQTFTYEFSTPVAAVSMYHAHNHGQLQITNGLFGTLITGDMPIPAGRTIGGLTIPKDIKISQRIPMVLNDAGVIGLSLNGKSFPATQPYKGKLGDWVEVDYMNEGLQIHPMHQHRFPQLVIAKDGIPLDSPYWVDTLNVAPGERYTVIFNLDAKGVWVWHCHILSHVEADTGAFGMLTAWIVE